MTSSPSGQALEDTAVSFFNQAERESPPWWTIANIDDCPGRRPSSFPAMSHHRSGSLSAKVPHMSYCRFRNLAVQSGTGADCEAGRQPSIVRSGGVSVLAAIWGQVLDPYSTATWSTGDSEHA